MIPNRISAEISQDQLNAALVALADIEARMPFLRQVPDDEGAILRLGTKGVRFVEAALELAAQNPEALGEGVSVEEGQRDFELYQQLARLHEALDRLRRQVAGAMWLAGAEAYAAAREVYRVAHLHQVGTANLDAALDAMGWLLVRRPEQQPGEAPEAG